MGLLLILMIVAPAVLFLIIRAAVQEGVYSALMRYDRVKENRRAKSFEVEVKNEDQ